MEKKYLKACENKSGTQRTKECLKHEKVCCYCNKKFKSYRMTALFCSTAHRINYYKRKKRTRIHDEKLLEIIKRYQKAEKTC